jgi:NodT family efflux transporter outer membrane factor (OMF) lipoprotein
MTRPYSLLLALTLTACTVGPNYHPPSDPTPAEFKEVVGGWKPANPRAEVPKGAWWSLLGDPTLDCLEKQVAVTNQNVKQAEAAYRQAEALVRETRADLFPTLGINSGASRSTLNATAAGAGLSGPISQTVVSHYSLQSSASWDLDVWGRIRRQLESQKAAAQVSAADLANSLLSAQAALAADYVNLRAADSQVQLLTDTVAAYSRTMTITENQYAAGTASRSDMEIARTQLRSAQAQLAGVGVQRAQFEHAIAVLTGHAPSELTIPLAPLTMAVPDIPVGVPTTLLERRPDIAAAERIMASQNAQIGVATAAFFPDISLSAAYGFAGDPVAKLLTAANRAWSLGATANQTLFDGGFRHGTVAAARANYDQSVAAYRQTVLTAFQQVEDDLSSLRILQRQAALEDAAVDSGQRTLDVTLNEYRAGIVPYTSVVTAQVQLLSDQQAALTIRQSRMVAAVALIEALGGGWTEHEIA